MLTLFPCALGLALCTASGDDGAEVDWLVRPPAIHATATLRDDGKEVVLENGLVRRVLRLRPDAATVAFDDLMTGTSLLRAVKPEARVTIDGKEFAVGGLAGQPLHAYLRPEWLDAMTANAGAFAFDGVEFGTTEPRFEWKRARRSESRPWPPPGVALTLHFKAPDVSSDGSSAAALSGFAVDVHYELFDGMPLLSKWIVLRNGSTAPHRIDRFVAEELAVVEAESRVEEGGRWRLPNLTVVTDFAFNGMALDGANPAVRWLADPEHATQVNYNLKTPCLLEVAPPLGPAVELAPGESLASMRLFELVHDSTDRERIGLQVRRMWRTIAPWCTESPLMLHLTSVDPAVAHTAIEQAAAAGFEMVIFSFGSGLNMEDVSPENLARFRALADFAHERGLELGGYSLLASRSIDTENDCINAATGKPGGMIFGSSPCLGSRWGLDYFDRITRFLEQTDFDLLEHDGSYPGDACASTAHPGHRDHADSQWRQFQQIAGFYRWCRGRGISLNVPDFYFLQGSTKTAMGYRETNWSLPRAEQQVHARLHLYDGTWEKTPTMGWMFVPLVQYHGGGAAATIEPLKEHLADYEAALVNCLGYGAQACYRGPRLFDAPETQALVTKWVTWFKEHRAILESDLIHLRRPDARDWDGILHVNPTLDEKALAVLWNPLDEEIRRTIRLPLHYAGLADQVGFTRNATLSINGGAPMIVEFDADERATLDVVIPNRGMTWIVVR